MCHYPLLPTSCIVASPLSSMSSSRRPSFRRALAWALLAPGAGWCPLGSSSYLRERWRLPRRLAADIEQGVIRLHINFIFLSCSVIAIWERGCSLYIRLQKAFSAEVHFTILSETIFVCRAPSFDFLCCINKISFLELPRKRIFDCGIKKQS